MRKGWVLVFVIIAWVVVITGLGRAFGGDDEILAKVGNEVITKTDFETRLKSFSSPAQQEALKKFERRKELLNSMVKARLLFVEGGSKGLTEKSDIQARLRMMRDDLITQEYVKNYIESKIEVTDEEAETYYYTNPEVRDRDYLKASRIVVEKEEEAKEVLDRLKKGESFKKLVYEKSIDKASKDKDGALEWFEKGRGDKTVEEALSKLENGDLSDIIKDKEGFAIYRLDEKKLVPEVPFSKVKGDVIKGLKYKKIIEMAEKEVEVLKKKIPVEAFYDKLKTDEEIK